MAGWDRKCAPPPTPKRSSPIESTSPRHSKDLLDGCLKGIPVPVYVVVIANREIDDEQACLSHCYLVDVPMRISDGRVKD